MAASSSRSSSVELVCREHSAAVAVRAVMLHRGGGQRVRQGVLRRAPTLHMRSATRKQRECRRRYEWLKAS